MRLTKPLFWLLTALWFAAGMWWFKNSDCSSCTPVLPPPQLIPTANAPGFSVSDSNWNLASNDNLRFGKSGSAPVLRADITQTLDSLVLYAKNNPSKKITITGFYKSDEKNTSSFENLGLARADALKKILINKGVAEPAIDTKSQMDESVFINSADTVIGGISMAFKNNAAAAAPKDDLFEPHTVYFNTGQNVLTVDAGLKNYLEKAKAYLSNHADKKLLVTGHTDNTGDPAKNITLSAGRAAFVKSELIKQGISADRIESVGKGMTDPIADNTTTEGKAKNRRVTIQLQ
jgi:OmpA-OmpF porin, OOP family